MVVGYAIMQSVDRERHALWLVNQTAVQLGIVSQEDADLCTRHKKSLQYRIDALLHPKTEEQKEQIGRAMWE